MDREEFRNRLKQYKLAREENPGLKYWEWKARPAEKDIPKYDEGTDEVKDNTYVAPIEKEQVFIPATGELKRKQELLNKLSKNGQIKSGAIDIVSPEFEILSGGIGIPRQIFNNRLTKLAKMLVSKQTDDVLLKSSPKVKTFIPKINNTDNTFIVSEDFAKELNAMYHRNISDNTNKMLALLGKEKTPSSLHNRLSATERLFLKSHNVDESIFSDKDIRKLKQLRLQSIANALERNQRVVTTPLKSEAGLLILQKNTTNGLLPIGLVNYGHDPYGYMRLLGRELLSIDNVDLSNDAVIGWILGELMETGVSKDLYNGLAHWLNQTSPGSGFISGIKLMSPEPTVKTLNKLNKTLVSNLGEYLWLTGTTINNPIYRITNPTGTYPSVKSLMFDPTIIKNGKIITDLDNPDIYFAEGGEVIDSRQNVLDRANKVASNYSDAKDFDLNPFMYAIRKFAKNTIGKGGISNCTLSATGWVDPNNQYMSAVNIFDNPNSGYTEIPKEYALPGDLLIAKNPIENTYHTMLIEKFNENDPILRYSRGGHDTEKNLVTGRSLMEYHKLDNEQGGNHTEDHYFRYNFPNEYWLPELVVTGKKK